ncbi:MAG: MgtC/SapB family protein, partial [Candidatus Omnitrophica bacterium]|nr:MgtC/SapB family protein [Candidatus Omnitrophota bacterium]
AHGRAAGLRTHILVCLGSALIMLTSIHIYEMYIGVAAVDPARIAAQVVSGIGFLGAGTILRFRASVRGLTTAASLWAVAGLGLAVGSGFYKAAFLTTFLSLVALVLLTGLEKTWIRRDWYRVLEIEGAGHFGQLEAIRKILGDYEVEIKDFDFARCKDNKEKTTMSISLKLLTNKYDGDILRDIIRVEGIDGARWK